jgi:hypothetical protein
LLDRAGMLVRPSPALRDPPAASPGARPWPACSLTCPPCPSRPPHAAGSLPTGSRPAPLALAAPPPPPPQPALLPQGCDIGGKVLYLPQSLLPPLHRDPGLRGAGAGKLRPELWLEGPEGGPGGGPPGLRPCAFSPFSQGPRWAVVWWAAVGGLCADWPWWVEPRRGPAAASPDPGAPCRLPPRTARRNCISQQFAHHAAQARLQLQVGCCCQGWALGAGRPKPAARHQLLPAAAPAAQAPNPHASKPRCGVPVTVKAGAGRDVRRAHGGPMVGQLAGSSAQR